MNSAVSAISFLKNNLLNDETNNQAALKKKKDDELPPVPLDLPSLPFSSSSLVTQHFSTCERVWSLSSVFEWCLKLKVWLHDLFISKREFKKALIKLIVFHKRDVPLDLIGQNADRIIDELLKSRAIFYCYGVEDNEDDEKSLPDPATGKVSTSKVSTSPDNVALASKDEPGILMDDSAYVSGVMVDLTDCYCHDRDHNYASGRQQNQTLNENHNENVQKRCYSFNCNLNRLIEHELQLKNTNIHEIVLGEDWASHWKLTAEDLRNFDKNVSKRQSLIFDLLRYEQTFIQRATCFVEIVGPEFIKIAQLLVGPEIVLINKFEDDMISPGKELVGIHEKSLFHPLLRILISNGKFISNLSEIANIYYNWSQVVKNSLLKYMSTVPMIEDLLKYELIKNWVDHNVRNISRVKELKVNGPLLFMSTFNSRYQLLPLQLSDIRKSFDSQDPEYIALTRAIDGIKKLGSKVNEMKVHADNIHALKRVYKQLTWKSSIQQPNINLGSENRRFLFRGDLSRKGDLKINTYINHLILLDNYLFITEKIKNPRLGGYNYKVVENPIPIELLLFEIKENQTLATSGGIEISLSKTLNLNPLTSPKSPNPVLPENEDEPSSFPIKLRYAGRGKHDSFTFSAKTERERMDWVNQLISARSSLCSRLKKTEPYNLNLISNTNFAYEFSNRITKLQVCAPHDPIESISTDAFTRLAKLGCNGDAYSLNNSRNHIIFSKAQSVSKFEYRGTEFYLVGLVNGVYLSDMQNRWKKVINGVDITKISVVTSINLVVILGNKQLRYYTLDLIINVYYERRDSMSSISLSNEPVSFYEIGRHREITMLFYAKRKGNSSGTTNFKVLIPETDNDGVFNAFKVVKKFYVEAECFGISIFNTSFAVHTHKGFEILELDKLIPRSIPEIPNVDSKKTDAYGRRLLQNGTNMSMATSTSITASSSHPGIDAIKRAMHASSIKPMGMFKLTNNAEFLLVYNDYAIFTNKHGKLSRFTMLKFDFKANSIAFKNNNLFLVCDEAIEIWSISDFVNGSNRLIQVIVGKDINMLDSNDLSFAMANPKVVGLQLIFRLDNVSTEVDNSLT
ncbi:hypothetical protein HYPBUDRAFT_140207 [Hyphopichia burtonii NRRL Y-1933]|uniref:CNH-domain-containing protein n=1 Tax=Hyphopichia burtonii NRRL Y-1933 TaxID=984485 RepID=A0A1E4RJD5_9ASCO|nr:hypothetical protein HYPBUDRAFT_140207 [Hyphopichia burtonii NRRL Y-1933]ODV67346.1 hypothetical protein HYPBUDRAFT_140207 [Hyphopichia burtonii NRRL Y-1933]